MKTSYINKYVVRVLMALLIVFGAHFIGYADVTPVSDRTSQVQDAIVAAIPDANAADEVTETHLATITSLNLRATGISELKFGDFSGLTGLTSLNLYGNQLSSLSDGIFEGLTALTTLRLGGNTVDPILLTVSLEKVGEDQFKAVVPTGAPFDIILPVSVTNGNISNNATTVTITKGSVESDPLTVTRTPDTTAAVTVDIGTLPDLPVNHYGYTLAKLETLPIDVISEVSSAEESTDTTDEGAEETTDTDEVVTNTAPMFTDGSITIRTIAENTTADMNIGAAVVATDANDDTLTYTLSGLNADAFSIDSSSGQLKTSAVLDYETQRVYTVTLTVSDGELTDTITVIISVIDTNDTPFVSMSVPVSERTPEVRDAIVAAVPGVSDAENVTAAHLATITSLSLRAAGILELKSGDFSGMTALTSLNLYGNMLRTLPVGVFEGLTALTSLRLGGNLVDPMLLIVSLQQVAENQFQAVIPTGAPFDVVLPIDVMNGSMRSGATTVTIPKGSLASASFTIISDTSAVASVAISALPNLPANHYGYILAKSAICKRTSEVADAIAAAVQGVSDCRNVAEIDLATITTLNLSGMSITSLQSEDFSGLFSLTTLSLSDNQLMSLPDGIFDALSSLESLDLSGNQLTNLPDNIFDGLLSLITLNLNGNQFTSLPDGIFSGLNSLAAVNLSGNSVTPLPLAVALQKIGDGEFSAVAPAGAPFDIVLSISVVNGSIDGDITSITIPAGSAQSASLTVRRTPDTIPAVTVDIQTLPNPPSNHNGYALTKSNEEPLEVIPRINSAPVFTDGDSTTRVVAENTAAGEGIGDPVSATDVDLDTTLVYSLDGADAESFSLNTMSGQLQTDAALDYETKNTYSVTITVSDGYLTDTIDVTITIADVDENRAPVFTDGESTTRAIAENSAAGTNIGSPVSATDADDDELIYSLSGPDAATFGIDPTSGQLKTGAALDYETKNAYSVTITVSDGRLTDSITVTIKVTDEDEDPSADTSVATRDAGTANNAPMFIDGSSSTRTVAENTGSGVNIGSAVAAMDADGHTLTYSLSGTDADAFSIDSTSGQLRTRVALDYETKNTYSVTITVSDGSLTDTITVAINVTDVDETASNNAPVFTEGSNTTRIIAENTGSDVDIGGVVSATDADGDTLTYTLGGTDVSSFSVDSSSGQLRTNVALDYETKNTYSVTITASDGSNTDTITVTIIVTDVEEVPSNNAPVFTDGSSTTRTIAENVDANTNIGSAISATDADDDTLTYTLGGTDATVFSIDPDTGHLKTNAALNYEVKNAYAVSVTVSDGSLTDAITVTINVLNANDAPVFTDGSSTTRAIAENVDADINIGAAVAATDADGDTLTYTLSGTDVGSFSIDNSSGQLQTNAALDFEEKNSYSVTVTVSDGKGGSDTISVTINITDLDETPSNNAPVFTEGSSTSRSVPENTDADENIGSPISATDADNNTLAYLLSGDDASAFSIDPDTGQLRTSAVLDFEEKNSYSVTVTVSDGGLTDTISVTITVTDVDENRAPTFASSSTTRSIAENTDAGENIGSPVSATDPDNDPLTYSLSGTNALAFSIVSSSGQLQTSAALDYETKDSYSVTVTVSDGNGGSDTIIVAIEVTDVDENRAPTFAEGNSTTRSVAENTDADENIGTAVAATDPDNDTLTYSLSGTNASSFDIDSDTGQLKTSAALDYETQTSYSVTVTVSDGNGGSDSINVTIEVTDVDENRAPAFAQSSTTRYVAENTGPGANIGAAVSATDPDAGDTLEYSLSGQDASAFSIDSSSGQLRTSAALDYETKPSYSVTVTASDGKLSDTISVTINVTDVDENRAPVFTDDSTTRSVAENTASGTDFGAVVSATDPDAGDTLEYSLSGMDASSFGIDPDTGQLRTSAALDYETQTSYSVTVSASDGSLSDSIDVTINVTDVKEAPVFTEGSSTSRSVAENTESGENIGAPVSATDDDGDTLEYALSGTDAASFSIDSETGQLKTNTALDYETQNSYSVTVAVQDGKGGTTTITVTINVTDIDENQAPMFSNTATSFRISDINNLTDGDNVGDPITATDADTDDTLAYSLGGDDASLFNINSSSGQLQVTTSLINDTRSTYAISVIASDGTDTASIAVTVYVTRVATQMVSSITPVSDRTQQVKNAIVDAIADVTSAEDVTETHLAAITTLNLDSKSITSLSSGDFDGLTGLTTLYLNYNDLSSLPSGIFDDLTSLTRLEIVFNELTSLPSGVFDTLTSLEILDLTLNEFSTLPADIFDNLSALKTLYLLTDDRETDNQLTSLPAGVFDGLTALEEIELEGNKLSSLPDGVFDENTALKSVNLRSNQLTTLPDDVFDENTNVTTLVLTANQLTSLPDDIFDNNTSLTGLHFGGNDISSLPAGIFDELTNLEKLYFSANELTALPNDIFDKLTELEGLGFAQNKLTVLSNDVFDNNTQLTHLDISFNNISSLPSDIFSNLTELTNLYMSSNNLTALPDGLLVGLTKLTSFECGFQTEEDLDIKIKVKLEKVADGQFKAVCPVGVPAGSTATRIQPNPIVTNGALHPDEITGKQPNGIDDIIIDIQISRGHTDSGTVSVVRTPGTTAAVTVDIGTILSVRTIYNHGYTFVRDADNLPLEVIPAVGGAPNSTQQIPNITTFLPNYPNPFNPETWIPYQLSDPADVSLTIYNMRGVIVRELALGHQPAGYYTNRSRAAYWDGRNGLGEKVAAGLYFCTFKAGDFTATRKMLILK